MLASPGSLPAHATLRQASTSHSPTIDFVTARPYANPHGAKSRPRRCARQDLCATAPSCAGSHTARAMEVVRIVKTSAELSRCRAIRHEIHLPVLQPVPVGAVAPAPIQRDRRQRIKLPRAS
jgi:hypothetical protein